MFRGGSFDRSGEGLELHEEWKKRREVEPSNTDLIRAASGIRTHQLSLVPTRVWGQAALAKRSQQKASSMVLMLFLLLFRHAAPEEIARNQVHMFAKHHGSDCEDELFSQYHVFRRRYC